MSTPVMIPMLAPDGTSGDIPAANVAAARQAGFKVAVTMQSPDGKLGYVPAERTQEAASAGFKMVPNQAPAGVQPSYWETLTNPVGSGSHDQGILGGIEQVGGQAIKTMAAPILHPIDTAEGIYNTVRHPVDTVSGIVKNFQNDQQQGGLPLAIENAVGQLAGTVEGGRAMAPVMKAAIATAPAAVSKAVLLGRTPEGAYESALKPSTALKPAERAAAIQTALQNAIPISKGGVEKIGDLIDDLNDKIKAEIAADPNRPIDPNMVATRADIARAKFAKQVNAGGDLNAIEASRQQFLQEQGAPPPVPIGPQAPAPPMGAADAQAMKQGTYRVLAGKYGEQGSASVEAQKALARGLKEEIATQFPEISNLNAAESKLLDLQPLLERAVNRISNHQAVGIGTPIASTAVATATGSGGLGAVAGILKGVLDNPYIKSRLAIAVSKGAKIPFSDALSKVSAYSTSLGSAVPSAQGASSGDTPNQSPSLGNPQ